MSGAAGGVAVRKRWVRCRVLRGMRLRGDAFVLGSRDMTTHDHEVEDCGARYPGLESVRLSLAYSMEQPRGRGSRPKLRTCDLDLHSCVQRRDEQHNRGNTCGSAHTETSGR